MRSSLWRKALALPLAVGLSLATRATSADPPADADSGERDGEERSERGENEPELLHMPLLERHAEQGILRPVPVSVELPEAVALRARRVLVHYRLWGDPDWITLELRREGTRYEGAVPCQEISTVTGDLRYYIRIHDVKGHVIASAASRAKPYIVAIKHDTTLDPDKPRVAKCPDPADCPRGLPGCPSERVIEVACQSDGDCEGGMSCSWRGFCERATRRTNWISAWVQQDIGVIARSGACSITSQERQGYACFRDDGKPYMGSPVLTNEPLGVGRGPTRVGLGYERLVHYNVSLGVRLGLAFGQGPTAREGTAFVPFSIAARATHWFGDDPFQRRALRPYAFLTAGYAMVDVDSRVHIREDPEARVYQQGNDLEQTADLRKRAGDGFAGLGGGLSLPLGQRTAFFAELAVLQAFPFAALVIAPDAGLMVGF